MEDLITATELAEKLRIRTCTILEWTRQGRIPAIRITERVIRYDHAEVLEALKMAQKRPRSEEGLRGHR